MYPKSRKDGRCSLEHLFCECVICSHIFGEFTFIHYYGLNVICPSQVQVFEHLVPQLVVPFGEVWEP